MPDKQTIEKAKQDAHEGKSSSTQAGEFVRAEIEKVRRGEHGVRSPEQAIAIGLSEARRAGVDVPAPKKGRVKETTRRQAERDREVGQGERKPAKRPGAARRTTRALKKEHTSTASPEALSTHAKRAAGKRSSAERSAAAKKGSRTKGAASRSDAARKGAATRARNNNSA